MMTDPYQEMIAAISRCKRLLITTHVRPDGDALGTTAALAMGLKKVGIAAEVLLLSALPAKYAFVFEENAIVFHDSEKGWPAKLSLDDFDALLVADTGTWSQLPGLRERVLSWPRPKLVVDHHLTQEDWATRKLVVKEAAASGEIVGELFAQWPIELDPAIATALYLALASDTGWFQYSNTRPFTLRLAATLMEAGAQTDQLYQRLYQSEQPQRIALQTRAMQSMKLAAENRVATVIVRRGDFSATGANVSATENLVNLPLQIETVAASLCFVEPPEGGTIRVSLRSKGAVDVAKFAEQFGGGGHARAAGLKLEGAIDEVRDRVARAMVETLERKSSNLQTPSSK